MKFSRVGGSNTKDQEGQNLLGDPLDHAEELGGGTIMEYQRSGTGDELDMVPRKGVLRRYDNKKLLLKRLQQLEQEAYQSVLRAFIAQSDVLSWAKESLMVDLRRELRVSDELHREYLKSMGNDDSVVQIRKHRAGGEQMPEAQERDRKRKSNATGVLKRFPKDKKTKTPSNVEIEDYELMTLEALQREIDHLEMNLDSNRLSRAKKAAHEYKRKLLEALDQCGNEDEDSEKTQDRDPAPEAADTQPQSQSQENIHTENTENTENTDSKPGHDDG